jgi:nicotinamide riboside kinase
VIGTVHRSPERQPGEDRLEELNDALADLLPRRGRPALVASGEGGRTDSLVLCGILGGKDVGKSTLINAIAQATVSVDTDEVGQGTSCPVAYVHADDCDALHRRLRASAGDELKVVKHEISAVRNLVLVDLPDFDSTFTRHLDIVRRAIAGMDRVIWICDPKKIGDRLWCDLLARVVKAPTNVYCALNKFDLLLRDEQTDQELSEIWQRTREHFSECLEALNVGGDPQQRFVLSAAYAEPDRFVGAVARYWGDEDWRRFPEARPQIEKLAGVCADELARLRKRINAPLGPDQARDTNRRAELRANVGILREHYDLPARRQLLEGALAGLAGELESRFDGRVIAVLAGRLARQGRSDAELADEVMKTRVEHWPILPALYWTFRGVLRWLGRKITQPASVRLGPSDLLRTGGLSIEDRLGGMQAALRARFSALFAEMPVDGDWPGPKEQAARVRSELEALVEQIDDRALDAWRAAYRRPRASAKLLVWVPLLWFPLVQPLAEGLLESIAAQGALSTVHGLSLVVRALGAASLLRGLFLVLALFVGGLVVMYARSLRETRALKRGALSDETPDTIKELKPSAEREPRTPPWDASDDAVPIYAEELRQVLADEVFAPLADPLEAAHARLNEIDAELERIAAAP